MVARTLPTRTTLSETDETAWLETTAELIRERRWEEVELETLAEYLTDMALRDRREVKSRLVTLLAHVLKWLHQPDHRSRSWQVTMVEQWQELADLVGHGVLRAHAEAVLAEAYTEAVERAVVETGLEAAAFPEVCPYALDRLLSADLLEQ